MSATRISFWPTRLRASAAYLGINRRLAARAGLQLSSRPLNALRQPFAGRGPEAGARIGEPANALVYRPRVSRKAIWTVLLDARTADVRGFLPLDSF